MAIKERLLSAITSVSNSDFVRLVTSEGASRKALVSDLAKQIIENYTGSTIAGSAQSVKSAVDLLKSEQDTRSMEQVGRIGLLADKNIDHFAANKVYGTWWLNISDSEVTGTKPASSGQGLLICKQQSVAIYRQVYIGISGNEFKYRYHNGSSWTAWADTAIRDEIDSLKSRYTSYNASITLSNSGNASLDSVIGHAADLIPVMGYVTGDSTSVKIVSFSRFSGNWYAHVQTAAGAAVTGAVNVTIITLRLY